MLTAAAAQFSFTPPGSQVPFTMQPVAVLLAGLALGARRGALSQALYLLAGVAGVSAFAWSTVLLPGAARLVGPTGGFLLAFPVAAAVAGYLSDRGFTASVRGTTVAMLAGLAVLYAGGAAWALLSVPSAAGGVLAIFGPYVAADVLKVVVVAPLVPALRRMVVASHP